MINLEDYERRVNRYGGSEEKRTYYKDGKYYLVKVPDKIREKNNILSYMNNAFSEYVSCQIFNALGVKAQNTELTVLKDGDKEKVVCVCEDFTDDTHILIEYDKSEKDKENMSFYEKSKEVELKDIINSIDCNDKIVNHTEAVRQFWKIFIIDALIYNGDRHIENWGFLENKITGECKIAPVYDCGSALFALYSEEKCLSVINTPREYRNLALNSFSALKENGARINYYTYINSLKNVDCNDALIELFPKIDINIIKNIINTTPMLSNIYKRFYSEVIETSYELVLKPAYEKIILQSKNVEGVEQSIEQNKFDFDPSDDFDF